MKKIIKEYMPYIVIIAAVLLLRIFLILNVTIPTGSMENTIMPKTRVMGLKTMVLPLKLERGDIVVFHAPDLWAEGDNTWYAKRLIGLPGDRIEIRGGVTYLNGAELDEPYLKEPVWDADFGPYEVPEGCYFMMGDNRNHSNDARYWKHTYVAEDEIIGKAYFSYWPKLTWLED